MPDGGATQCDAGAGEARRSAGRQAQDCVVTVVGLGYVGCPLAVALARRFAVTGFDISSTRIAELAAGLDRTGEVPAAALAATPMRLTADWGACPPSDVYIVTVPTPIDSASRPDLAALRAASVSVGRMLPAAVAAGKRPIVVFESTVYPGVTEEVCGPILADVAQLSCGVDFFLGYSPERVNPGDREHTIERITKVIAGQTPEVSDRLEALYGAITAGGVFRAASIRAAEAAKVIENAQRDINIAFINEIAQIFGRMGLSVWDVLAAARTKWNFLDFAPGLVGGHCIGVDPYYLAHKAQELGHEPRVILAGRGVNDGMAAFVAERLHEAMATRLGRGARRVLVLGLTFKEDVPDLRNSKVADLAARLAWLGHEVAVHDPLADPAEALAEHDLALDAAALARRHDCVLLAVPHRPYLALGEAGLRDCLVPGGLLADLKGALGGRADWTL